MSGKLQQRSSLIIPSNQHVEVASAAFLANNTTREALKTPTADLNISNRSSVVYTDSTVVSAATSDQSTIVAEFVHLLDKSRQLFNGLRELPQYGHQNNQWQAYFGRTFDVYTKLWKYQQEHRHVLEQKYSLKRWQIGEIASKIGQLYYHY
jgi:hypothetical protein